MILFKVILIAKKWMEKLHTIFSSLTPTLLFPLRPQRRSKLRLYKGWKSGLQCVKK